MDPLNLRATSMDDSVSRLRFDPDNVLVRESHYEETGKHVDTKQKIDKESEILIKEVAGKKRISNHKTATTS